MAIVYKRCTEDGTIPEYKCDACGIGELGRVRGAFFLDRSVLSQATEENLKSIEWWETQIKAKTVYVIPKVRGTYDGGTINTIDGFGDETEKVTGKTHVLTFNDANHKGNNQFYEALQSNKGKYVAGFVTDTELRIGAKPLTGLEAKDAVEEDATTYVLWNITATWIQNKPSILDIIDLEEAEDVRDLFRECIDSISPDVQTMAKVSKKSE